MLREFRFPDVGEGIAEGEIVRWLANPGDRIQEDQELVEVETDKAVITLNSPFTGRIDKLHAKEGEIIRVGALLTTVQDDQPDSPAPPPAEPLDFGSVVGSLAPEEDTVLTAPVLATPAVRTLAKALNLDLTRIKGTGPDGRVTKDDVEKAAKAGRAENAAIDSHGPIEKIALRGLRRTVAKRMTEASRRVADVTIWEDADITELAEMRARQRPIAEASGVRLTYLPYLIQAAVAALKTHPYFNASLDETTEEIILKKYYHMGIAVDTSDGLIVFVIKDADRKSILELAREGAGLAEKARQRKLDLTELRGSTFTITNYGVVGASYGTPIINHPEVAILGLGKIADKPIVHNGQIAIRKIMPLSLAFDHRVIDGVEAGRFLGVVIEQLENPHAMSIAADEGAGS